jgi:hypothetical protein
MHTARQTVKPQAIGYFGSVHTELGMPANISAKPLPHYALTLQVSPIYRP